MFRGGAMKTSIYSLIEKIYLEEDNYELVKNLSLPQISSVVNLLFEEIRSSLNNKEEVSICGFGIFRVKIPSSKTRSMWDISTKKKGVCKLYPRVKFDASFRVKGDKDEN